MSDQEKYKEWVAGVFSRSSETYSQVGPNFFNYFGSRLVEFIDIQRGASVLDIASGRGAILFPSAQAVGESGQVTGIDLAEGMVQQINHEIVQRSVNNAKVTLMDVEQLVLPENTFDFASCGFALFFFPDLPKALFNIYNVLKPGGVFGATTFKQIESGFREEISSLNESYEDKLKPVPDEDTNYLDTFEKMEQAYQEAGFSNIKCELETKTFYNKNAAEWWESQWSHGRRGFLERIPEEELPGYKEQALKIVQKYTVDEGIPFTPSIIYSQAQKLT